ncbi:surface protein TolT, putative [Trypanosoma cruzi]|nr:surface protein TolT, putative [Trypanosoma cruzi]
MPSKVGFTVLSKSVFAMLAVMVMRPFLCALLFFALCRCFPNSACAASATANNATENASAMAPPADMRGALREVLGAMQKAQEYADEANRHCVQARMSAESAREHEEGAKNALRKLGSEATRMSRALQQADEAVKLADAAVVECKAAEEAAQAAGIMTLDAVGEVLKHLKDEKTKVGSGPELLTRAAEQTVLSLEKAKEAEAEAEKAAAAAQKTREAAEKAAAARTLAQDVAATASALLRQREKEEERRRARDRVRAYVGNERAENAMRVAWLDWVECCVAVLVNEGAEGGNGVFFPIL